MKSKVWLLGVSLVGCVGYEPHNSDGGASCKPSDLAGADLLTPDLATAQPMCAAGKGLPGVPLICTDFSSVQTLSDLKGMGWDFMSKCPVGWTVSNSNLQVNGFSDFQDTCIFTTRALTTAEYQQYDSFMLSVVQTIDLNPAKQTASIYLGSDVSSQQVTTTTGTNLRQRNITEFAKTALPNGGNNGYQPLFKIFSGAKGGGFAGWQIESIAVMGIHNP